MKEAEVSSLSIYSEKELSEKITRAPKVVFMGLPFSGKSKSGLYLNKEYGLNQYSYTNLIKNLAEEEYGLTSPFTRDQLRNVGIDFNERMNGAGLSKRLYEMMVEDLKTTNANGGLFDSLRLTDDADFLIAQPNTVFVELWAPTNLRERRARESGRTDLDLSNFTHDDERELEKLQVLREHMFALGLHAEGRMYFIENNDNLFDLHSNLDSLMKDAYSIR